MARIVHFATNLVQRQWHISFTVASIVLFSVALTQPAFFWGKSAASSGPGWRLLLDGWRGLWHGYFEWFANPALFISWALALLGHRALAVTTASASSALMLVFLSRRTLEVPTVASATAIVSYGTGYWLWLGSALLMVVSSAPRTSATPGAI